MSEHDESNPTYVFELSERQGGWKNKANFLPSYPADV